MGSRLGFITSDRTAASEKGGVRLSLEVMLLSSNQKGRERSIQCLSYTYYTEVLVSHVKHHGDNR